MNKNTILQDLILEKEALDKKLLALSNIDSSGLAYSEKMLLRRQEDAMSEYSYILGERIDRLAPPIDRFDRVFNDMGSEHKILIFSDSDKYQMVQEALSRSEDGRSTFEHELRRAICARSGLK